MILQGDCIEVMKAIKPNSIDAIVTDPPYGLEFMGKEWDKLWDNRKHGGFRYNPSSKDLTESRQTHGPQYKAGLEAQLWHTQWLIEAFRVLKPGASMLVMGGTRTFHRLMVAIEDSGFIIKDCLMWIYGSGFPKAQDLGKMIDKRMGAERVESLIPTKKGNLPEQAGDIALGATGFTDISKPISDLAKHWDGFKIGGIKPAYEPIVWAVKPPEGSYIDNILKWGVGTVNVDECRIETEEDLKGGQYSGKERSDGGCYGKHENLEPEQFNQPKGRFPANIILDEEAGRAMDEQSGKLKSGKDNIRRKEGFFIEHGKLGKAGDVQVSYGDNGGASRFFYCAKASRGERNRGCEELEEKAYAPSNQAKAELKRGNTEYNAWKNKPHTERNNNNHVGFSKNHHPTVKPIALFEWLIKLVTREGQVVLDPFLGSGTTAIAAHQAGRECVGIEREDDYVEIAKRRIDHWESQPQQRELQEAGNV